MPGRGRGFTNPGKPGNDSESLLLLHLLIVLLRFLLQLFEHRLISLAQMSLFARPVNQLGALV